MSPKQMKRWARWRQRTNPEDNYTTHLAIVEAVCHAARDWPPIYPEEMRPVLGWADASAACKSAHRWFVVGRQMLPNKSTELFHLGFEAGTTRGILGCPWCRTLRWQKSGEVWPESPGGAWWVSNRILSQPIGGDR